MKKQTQEFITFGIIALAILMASVTYGYNTFFVPHPDLQNITLNVVGIINATNSSLVSLQFECIKFCGTIYYTSARSHLYVENCWKECEKLGRGELNG